VSYSPEAAETPALTKEQAIANLQQKEDPGLRYYAAWWLGRFRVKDPQVIDLLIAALEDESDRTPDGGYSLRRNAATALGKLGEVRAVPALLECLHCSDYYVRESAAQALEMLGCPSAIPALLALLEEGVEAAVAVEGKPHLIQPYEAILEALGTLGAKNALNLLEPFLRHPLPKIQLAAARSLYQLTGERSYGERLVQGLEENELQLRRSALMDLGASGYLEASEAIADTLAENSLKLIALKGLLGIHLSSQNPEEYLTPDSLRLMGLMDKLL
jgi:phycocyanobilin lyase alpha subunit